MDPDDIEFAHSQLQQLIILIATQTDTSVFEAADILRALITDTDFKIWTQSQYVSAMKNGHQLRVKL